MSQLRVCKCVSRHACHSYACVSVRPSHVSCFQDRGVSWPLGLHRLVHLVFWGKPGRVLLFLPLPGASDLMLVAGPGGVWGFPSSAPPSQVLSHLCYPLPCPGTRVLSVLLIPVLPTVCPQTHWPLFPISLRAACPGSSRLHMPCSVPTELPLGGPCSHPMAVRIVHPPAPPPASPPHPNAALASVCLPFACLFRSSYSDTAEGPVEAPGRRGGSECPGRGRGGPRPCNHGAEWGRGWEGQRTRSRGERRRGRAAQRPRAR